MKRIALILCVFALAAGGCRDREQKVLQPGETTQTIAPAAAQPSPTGTDAMTQTVELQDGRSEAEGGVITNPNPPLVNAGGQTQTTATTNTATQTTTTGTTATTSTRR